MQKTIKNKKFTRKISSKKKKNGFSYTLRAFFMVGIIIVISVIISFVVIFIHFVLNNDDSQDIIAEIESTPVAAATSDPVAAANLSVEPTPVAATNSTNSAAVTPRPPRPVESLGNLVFVIDDAGNNLRELEPFLRIPFPLTIAVLPGLPYSAEAARRIRAAGKEVILHQPMEAVGGQYPGPGTIYSGMSADEIKSILIRNIAEIGPVVGMNNHQGSKITMDREAMETILAFCAANDLYFLDSRTISESVVPVVAREMGMAIAERNIFIDNEQNKDAMLRFIESGLVRAGRNGSAVMLGHTWSPDLAPLLAEQFPLFTQQGYTIMTVSDIIKTR